MIVLDASVLIAHLDAADALHAEATALLDEHAATAFRLAVLTRAEVLVRPAQAGSLQHVRAALDRLGVETGDLDAVAADRLAQLRADTGLRLPDCCVLLEAERAGADLATFDARLAAVARTRGVRVVP